MSIPKITFGIIVLNGEPFVRYNLRSLYPFAHQIIVVEGAAPAAKTIATPNGHSIDNTLDILNKFKSQEDPENKLIIVTAEDEGYPNGFWLGEKHEQSQAYARRATGDYLWQVDIDEFYMLEDMQAICDMLQLQPEITAISFKQITFWGGFDYIVDSWYLRRGAHIYHRLFKWGDGYSYKTHRPPTVCDPEGRDLRRLNWVDGNQISDKSIYLYHYSLVFPNQVKDKSRYYEESSWARRDGAQKWAQEIFLELRNPYRVHNVFDYPGWLVRYQGRHPHQVDVLRSDIQLGLISTPLRKTDDIDALLNSHWYQLGCVLLRVWEPWDLYFKRLIRTWSNHFLHFVNDPQECLEMLSQKYFRHGKKHHENTTNKHL